MEETKAPLKKEMQRGSRLETASSLPDCQQSTVVLLNGSLPAHDVHLFVRPNRLRGAKAAPFTYCGVVAFQKWEGEKPITVTWKLSNPVPDHLRRLFKIEV